jgi:hypothetical protein
MFARASVSYSDAEAPFTRGQPGRVLAAWAPALRSEKLWGKLQ